MDQIYNQGGFTIFIDGGLDLEDIGLEEVIEEMNPKEFREATKSIEVREIEEGIYEPTPELVIYCFNVGRYEKISYRIVDENKYRLYKRWQEYIKRGNPCSIEEFQEEFF
ncbi:MAG: hypothetical protein QW156_03930 [Candidatus Aenigmatarchaeota archaeon]